MEEVVRSKVLKTILIGFAFFLLFVVGSQIAVYTNDSTEVSAVVQDQQIVLTPPAESAQ